MVLFDHSIKCSSTLDEQLDELMTTIEVDYTDAFGERQQVILAVRDSDTIKEFSPDRVIVAGTATTGSYVSSGAVLSVRDGWIDLVSGAKIHTCRWIDKKPPSATDVVHFFEALTPHGDSEILATARKCLHPQLMSINFLVLNRDGDIDDPIEMLRVSPFTGEYF